MLKPIPRLRSENMNCSRGLMPLVLCAGLAACGPAETGLSLGEERSSPGEAADTSKMIAAIKDVSLARHPAGLVQRFNQSKTLGCFNADFAVPPNLDPSLQQGIFVAGTNYRAQLRFANATKADDRDKDFRGLSIKVQNTSGSAPWEDALWGESGRQDFLLNSYPALFAANPGDFLDFIEATRDDRVWRYFINPAHFYSLGVVLKGRKKIDNPFAINYWSTTPYRFGDNPGTAVKYSVRPCASQEPSTPTGKTKDTQDFLSDVMRDQLKSGGACFDFMVQFQQDPDSMPIENASVIWDETSSAFLKVASIELEAAMPSADLCEQMTFNPWQSLEAHRPLGGINRTRKPIYSEIGQFRSEQNRIRGGS